MGCNPPQQPPLRETKEVRSSIDASLAVDTRWDIFSWKPNIRNHIVDSGKAFCLKCLGRLLFHALKIKELNSTFVTTKFLLRRPVSICHITYITFALDKIIRVAVHAHLPA